MSPVSVAAWVLLAACRPPGEPAEEVASLEEVPPQDDNGGYSWDQGDCAPEDPDVYPGAEEV